RDVYGGDRRGGEHASGGVAQRDPFGARDRRGSLEDERQGFVQRQRLAYGTHGLHRLNSLTTWPISGRISFVIPSRTAFSDPGSENTAVRAMVPAEARDNMAADPISS